MMEIDLSEDLKGRPAVAALELEGSATEVELVVGSAATPGGTKDYEKLDNKPRINSRELVGDMTSEELGVQPEGDYPDDELSNFEIEQLLK